MRVALALVLALASACASVAPLERARAQQVAALLRLDPHDDGCAFASDGSGHLDPTRVLVYVDGAVVGVAPTIEECDADVRFAKRQRAEVLR
jgi:hypothetical protein